MNVVEVSHLVKRFGSHTAVDDVGFAVPEGAVVGLLGPNGSGKTTLINLISGLMPPTEGSVHLLGHDLAKEPMAGRAALGVVPQETALYEELSAEANLQFHAELYGVPRPARRQAIDDMLDLVQLSERRRDRVGTFSGGMKRRLAIARALLHNPRVVYLDEPTLGVDVQARQAIWDYIREMPRAGRTVLLTTNYLEEAQALCDHIFILDHGRLIAQDSPEGLKRRFGSATIQVGLEAAPGPEMLERLHRIRGVSQVQWTAEVTGGLLAATTDADETVDAIVSALVREILPLGLKTLAVREPSLDEIFLALTGRELRD